LVTSTFLVCEKRGKDCPCLGALIQLWEEPQSDYLFESKATIGMKTQTPMIAFFESNLLC